MRRSLVLALLLAVVSTGCTKFYWTKSGAQFPAFADDHRECLQAAGLPVANRPGYVVVSEQDFRRCLVARGWSRYERRPGEYGDWTVRVGLYRGLEDLENLTPVAITDLPEQPPSAKADVKYFSDEYKKQYVGPQGNKP